MRKVQLKHLNQEINKMNEQFIPIQKMDSLEVKANIEYAKAAGDPAFLEFLQLQVKWQPIEGNLKKLVGDDDLNKAVDLFDEMKVSIKNLDDLRLQHVAFPTKVVSMVNSLFKQVRDGMARSKDHVGRLIDVRRQEVEREFQRKKLEAEEQERKRLEKAKKGEKQDVVTEEVAEGIKKVQMEIKIPDAPENTVVSTRGAKVHTRQTESLEIVDLAAFLKLLVSKDKRNGWLVEKRGELVKIDTGLLQKLMKDNKKAKVGGMKVVKESKTI
jgi:hypothetical protein